MERASVPLGWFAALALGLAAAPACALTVPPPPDPGLEASLRGADAIAEVEVLAGGPFRACAAVQRVFRGQLPKIIELEGYNTYNGDAAHGGFATGTRWILCLSRTDRPEVFAPLTPSAPRLAIGEDGVLFSLGDPPFRIPVKQTYINDALALAVEREQTGAVPERAFGLIRELWDRGEVEPRYLAVALAGLLHEPRAVPLVAEAARDKLLRLRLTAVEALRKLATPEALAVLRALLKDERETVAREAAAALIEARDVESLGSLLDWARRAGEALSQLPAGDTRREKPATLLNQLYLLVLDVGPLRPVEQLAPGLLALARSPDNETATSALFVLDRLAQPAQIQALLELAEDPGYRQKREAALALFRATLRLTDQLPQFREWWKGAQATFGEAERTAAVRSAVLGLALGTGDDAIGQGLALLLAAPGELALPEMAGLLLRDPTGTLIETRHLALWRTPLVLPFYLERLASDDEVDRRAALNGLAILARNHPRLRTVLRPLLRAGLADPDSVVRRTAAAACGWLDDAAAFPLLLDSLRGIGGYESAEATRAVYDLSARTLGYSVNELEEDNQAALRRLASWWEALGPGARAQWTTPLAPPPARTGATLAPAELEGLCQGASSATAGAAFAALFAERGPADPFWTRLLASARPRDRAHALLGLCGGQGPPPPALAQGLASEGTGAELIRAMAIVALASLKGGRGPDLVVEWLEGPGATAQLPLRRLAVLCLGLAEGEPKSRAFLGRQLEAALVAEEPVLILGPARGQRSVSLRAIVSALAAREDGSAALTQALTARLEGPRETAIRMLALRRQYQATPQVLEALGRTERFTVFELARAAAPLLRPADAAQLAGMLKSEEDAARLAAAILLAERPEVGAAASARAALIAALQDPSSYVRARAVEALGKLRARSAVPSLVLLLNDTGSEVRTVAIEALGRIGDPEGGAAAAAEAHRYTRMNSRWMRALGLSGGLRDVEALLTASRADSWLEQQAALEGLGLCDRPEAQARLLALFRDSGSPYQTHAGDALAEDGGVARPRGLTAQAVAALEPDFQAPRAADRARTLYWLARVPVKLGREHLLRGLAEPEANLRQLADWVLRRLTGQDAGYDPQAPPVQREAAIARWREMLQAPMPPR